MGIPNVQRQLERCSGTMNWACPKSVVSFAFPAQHSERHPYLRRFGSGHSGRALLKENFWMEKQFGLLGPIHLLRSNVWQSKVLALPASSNSFCCLKGVEKPIHCFAFSFPTRRSVQGCCSDIFSLGGALYIFLCYLNMPLGRTSSGIVVTSLTGWFICGATGDFRVELLPRASFSVEPLRMRLIIIIASKWTQPQNSGGRGGGWGEEGGSLCPSNIVGASVHP